MHCQYRPFLNTFLIVKTLEIYKEFLVGLQKVGVFLLILEKKGHGPDIGIYF